MKTIELSDEDYKSLMEFSKELQTQANHSQAFPYFWEAASEKLVTDPNNEGEVSQIFDENSCECTDPESYAEENQELFIDFLIDQEEITDRNDKLPPYSEVDENEWVEYIDTYGTEVRIYSSNWEQSSDHNPSLFLSDVQHYIKTNKHHLGRNPCTYANTIQRMYKMEKLVEIIYRFNPQPKDDVNHEAARFVFKKQ